MKTICNQNAKKVIGDGLEAPKKLPRLKMAEGGNKNNVWMRYRKHDIHLNRKPGRNWYIQVIAPDGQYAYDGFWRDSEGKSIKEAALEALNGACLWPNYDDGKRQ